MKKILLLLICFGFLSGCNHQSFDWSQINDRQQVLFQINQGEWLTAEVVTSPSSQALGLGERDEIGVDGMIFPYSSHGVPSFWMKGMRFDLDIVWISDNRVVGVTSQVPAPEENVLARDLPTYQPSQPINLVLELAAGRAQELGIERDSLIKFRLP